METGAISDATKPPPLPMVASGPPDWVTQTEDVLCPLCEYNLRGLTEPRCPECGYRFVWSELLDRRRREHPYLFEHHPRRPIWSFWKTLAGGLRPRTFWTSLDPMQKSRSGRLAVYWLISVALLAAGAGGGWVREFALNGRLGVFPFPNNWQPGSWYYSTDWGQVVSTAWVMVLGWCGLTFLGLMIFRGSMRRAKVRTAHVVRCVLYSFDAVAWVGLLAAAAGLLDAALIYGGIWTEVQYFTHTIAALVVLCPLIVIYRLFRAYRHYLRFDHSLATILSTQLIVVLVVLIVLANGLRLHW